MHFFKKSMACLAVAAVLFSFTVKPEKASFAGSWVLNEGKSESAGRFTPKKFKVEQKEDAITISRTAASFNNDDVTTTESLSFDGKPTESTVFGNSKKKSTAKWSEDGKALTISYTIAFERNGQTFDVNGTETWSLSADGKNLSVQTVTSSPQGERTSKAVYDKE